MNQRHRNGLRFTGAWFTLTACFGCPLPFDTTSSTFDEIQATIFTPSCATVNCHGQPTGAPMSLVRGEAYADLVGKFSEGLPYMRRVKAFSLEDSFLWHKINDTAKDLPGVEFPASMPFVGPLLNDEQLGLIRLWITNGASKTEKYMVN
jgi:hypothetical protein